MFTGLVADIGRVVEVAASAADARDLDIESDAIAVDDLAIGESIAVDGVCLTVTSRAGGRFRVTCGPETLSRTTLGKLASGARVNLERALRASDRLGGHIVAGHVDGVGRIAEKRDLDTGVLLRIEAGRSILRYVVEKGSIAVDGISLTVNRQDKSSFQVALIPHTIDKTTLGEKTPGAAVNLEVDIIGKYVEKLLAGRA